MKSYEEYLRSHDGWHEMVAQLHRDILAELEQLGKRMDDLENEELGFPPAITAIQEMCMALQDVLHATEDRMNARLAKLEEARKP